LAFTLKVAGWQRQRMPFAHGRLRCRASNMFAWVVSSLTGMLAGVSPRRIRRPISAAWVPCLSMLWTLDPVKPRPENATLEDLRCQIIPSIIDSGTFRPGEWDRACALACLDGAYKGLRAV